MRLLSLLYAHYDPLHHKTYINTREYALGHLNFLYRGSVKEAFKFLVRETLQKILQNSTQNQRHAIKHEQEICYLQVIDAQSAVFIICDQEYPQRVAYSLLQRASEVFTQHGYKLKELKNDDHQDIGAISKLFQDYQDPMAVDKLYAAQNTLQQTEVILHDNIKQLLGNQQDLDELVAKSEDISSGAKMFYKQSKKMNKRCCLLF